MTREMPLPEPTASGVSSRPDTDSGTTLTVTCTQPRPGTLLVTAVGEVDLRTAPGLRRHVLRAGYDHVIVDLSRVTFLGTAGLSLLAEANRQVGDEHGPLVVVSGDPVVRRALDVTGLAKTFVMQPSLDLALAAQPASSERSVLAELPPGQLRIEPLTGLPGLRVAGEVDLATRKAWEGALAETAGLGVPVHLDLAAVTFIDARGVALLVASSAQLGGGNRMVLHNPPRCLRIILERLWPDGVPTIEVVSP